MRLTGLFGAGRYSSEKLRDLAGRLNGFEILVGRVLRRPFARLPKACGRRGYCRNVAARIYLTDTLESPNRLPDFTASLLQERLTEERARAQTIKKDDAGDLVCIGNPPYDRESDKTPTAMREGAKAAGFATATPATSEPPILEDFLAPVRESGEGEHLKNVYNDYVYFWRWALWKVLDSSRRWRRIVSFITASSYLRGPAIRGDAPQDAGSVRRALDNRLGRG